MPQKEYRLGYVMTKGNGRVEPGTIQGGSFDTGGWCDEKKMLAHVTKSWLENDYKYVGTILETREVPTQEELDTKAYNVRMDLKRAIGIFDGDETKLTADMDRAIGLLVRNRLNRV